MLILQSKGTLALMEQWLNKKWWYTQWTGIYFYPVFDQVFENANMLTLYYFTTIKSGYRYRDAINRSFISGDKYRLWSDAFPRSPCSISPHTSIQSVYRMVLLIWVSFFRSKKKCPSKDEPWISGYLFREVQLRKLCFDKSIVDISTNRMKRAVSLIFV